MNVPLLLQVKAKILEEPKRFDMKKWSTYTRCGTAHCIGGWANHLCGFDKYYDGFPEAQKNLDVYGQIALTLFHVAHWHEPYRTKYLESNKRQRATIAADYIDFFISIYGEYNL